jgi:tetratricopeptide (TPR) repeat protein
LAGCAPSPRETSPTRGGCHRRACRIFLQIGSDRIYAPYGTDDRFWMLETIQEFALERLEESGEEEQLRRRHADWFLGLAERADSERRTPDLRLWLDRLAADHDNFRSALEWMLALGEVEPAVRLASSLQPFFEARGHFTEGRRWLEAGLQRTKKLPVAVRAKAVYGLARFAHGQGDYGQAAAQFTEASELFRVTHNAAGVLQALTGLGGAERRCGDLERAEALGRATIELARTLGDSWDLSSALHSAALTAYHRRDHTRARALGEESLELRRAIEDVLGTPISLDLLGWITLVEGDLGRAAILLEEALSLARDVNDTESIANALDNLGLVALKLSDYDRAAEHITESLTLAAAMGHRTLAAECLGGMAAVAAASGSPDRFALLLGASEGLHEAVGSPFNEVEQWIQDRFVEQARTELGAHVFSAERAKGKAMSLEQAVEYASSVG